MEDNLGKKTNKQTGLNAWTDLLLSTHPEQRSYWTFFTLELYLSYLGVNRGRHSWACLFTQSVLCLFVWCPSKDHQRSLFRNGQIWIRYRGWIDAFTYYCMSLSFVHVQWSVFLKHTFRTLNTLHYDNHHVYHRKLLHSLRPKHKADEELCLILGFNKGNLQVSFHW